MCILIFEFTITNKGLRITSQLWVASDLAHFRCYFLPLYLATGNLALGIPLKKISTGLFERIPEGPLRPPSNMPITGDKKDFTAQTIYMIVSNLSSPLQVRPTRQRLTYFPPNRHCQFVKATPRASWDVLRSLFYTDEVGTSIKGFFGLMYFTVLNNETQRTPELGIFLIDGAWGLRCCVFL